MFIMSLETCPRVLVGGTLIDGTGAPPIKDSVVILRGDYIVEVGKRDEIEIPSGAEVYDISGKTIMPGLIDSHCHFLWMGVAMKTRVLLDDTKSIDEALKRVKKRIDEAKPGEWILGNGWDESKWVENRYLTKDDLDDIAPNNPVMLSRVCGHLVSINKKAMEVAGITRDTQDTEGGHVDKDDDGENTGILRDCRYLVEAVIPSTSIETMVEGLRIASDYALSLGCSGIHDAGLTSRDINAYQQAEEEGKLKVRSYIMIRGEGEDAAIKLGVKTGLGDDMVQLGPVKLLMDGSLGARTAALFEPYEDEPSTSGLLLIKPEVLTEKIVHAHEANLQTATHAIGDLAVEKVLDSIQEALRRKPKKNHRHRIEHCELTSAQQIERIKQLGIIPDMQPNFIGEWSGPGSMYRQRLGERRDRMSNQYRAMLDEGIKVAFGSDGMPFNPIYGIWSAVNHPIKENRITLEEAVMCYTLNAAYAGFHEEKIGSVEEGKLGDISVFNGDLSKIPIEEIRNAKCYMTLVNGKILYHADF
ncbi:amidohydrolase [Candidatus Bathyarchaeota archaeon]|nr:MAG: amidohydrolase [Candidatus Bathyarchaeota archaeon]